jgi:hypothetical protein
MNPRVEPSFSVDLPLEFDGIGDVLQLARRVAREDFQRHLVAVMDAVGDDDQRAAGLALGKSIEAAQLADRAYRSFMASEATFAVSAGEAALGHAVPSSNGVFLSAGFEASAHLMQDAAEKATRFADYAPSSKFFQAALTAVMKTDAAFAKVETAASAKVDGFVNGLKAFGQRMSDFGAQIAAVPEKTRVLAEKTAVSTKSAAKSVLGRFVSRVRGAADGISSSVQAQIEAGVAGAMLVHTGVKESAWALLDDAADFAVRQQDRVKSVASTVDTHARAIVGGAGLAGGLLYSMGRKVAQGYSDQVQQVEAAKAMRRPSPR